MNDLIYDAPFSKTFQPRKPEDFRRPFELTIYAVGRNVEEALEALGKERKWGKVEGIEWQEVDVPCEWYVRFIADGTSMKASGEFITGGVIVTWWK